MDIQYLETRLTRRPYSPLFARIANEYLSHGRIDDAKELCLSGLEKYPTYTTAHLTLAKCYAAEHNYPSAIQSLEYVKTIFPDSLIVNGLYDEWQGLVHPSPVIEVPVMYDGNQALEEVPIIEEAPLPVELEPEILLQHILPSPVEKEIAQPVEQQPVIHISQEELAQIGRPPTTLSDEGRIVSKTLAEIFATQGEFGEAIITYELLKQQRPERSVEFEQRISELEMKMKEKMAR